MSTKISRSPNPSNTHLIQLNYMNITNPLIHSTQTTPTYIFEKKAP